MRTLLIFLGIFFFFNPVCHGISVNQIDIVKTKNRIETTDSSKVLLRYINQAWDVSWERFYHHKTNLFYDYLVSYERGKELSHLPTADEASRLYPNIQGYDTGMEDCMISAGIMLCMIVDQYDVTRNEKLNESAYAVFKGIHRCATAHGVKGFLARGVCVEDSKSIYIGSSRDQITHAVYGLWHYFHSSLSNKKIEKEIKEILSSIADRSMRNVIPENDFNFLRADGTPDPLLKMWDNSGHEAARLPMIYAAAWDVTRKPKYYIQYQKYLHQAIDRSNIDMASVSSWALLQMQSSLELLKTLEQNTELIRKMDVLMQLIYREACFRATKAYKNSLNYDLTMVASDWRLGGGIKWESDYRKVWYCVRESGEAALMQLLDLNNRFLEDQKYLLIQAITQLDYNQVSTSGIFYLQGAYWKARKRKIL